MSILKKTACIGTIISGIGLTNFVLCLSTLPHSNSSADLTVVFTGNNGRIKDALNIFAQNCKKTKQWLLISGIHKKFKLASILKGNNISFSKECKKRIILGSHALKTSGNAKELKLALSILKTNYSVSINSIQLMTSWCHAPRSFTEVKHQKIKLPSGKKMPIGIRFVGSCHLLTSRGATLSLSEIVKLPFAQMNVSKHFSKLPFTTNGTFRRNGQILINNISP